MTALFFALLAAIGGAIGGYFYAAPRRRALDSFARRSRVLYELAEGDLENVALELEQVAEREPGDATLFLALAALDRRRGRIERAKAIHRTVRASATLPAEQRVAALVGLGRDLLAQGNERAAIGALVRAISLAPRSVATLESLAMALEQAGAWERAAAAWERHEKLVEGRRRRESRQGRGHSLAGQAAAALAEGDDRKARKLAERAIELAPDSGHVWTTRARVEASKGDRELALEAWQRAWESAPAAASVIATEAWRWAGDHNALEDLLERMLASLRSATNVELVTALVEYVARQHHDQATAALERVAKQSAAAALALVRLRLARGQRDGARDAAVIELEPPAFICGRCGAHWPRFRFRCDQCGAWDSLATQGTTRGQGPGWTTPALARNRPAVGASAAP